MAITCIPQKDADKLRTSIKSGEFDIAKMYEMSSKQRREIFAKYVGEDLATFINTNFEKAMVSNRQTALKEWVEETFKGRDALKKKDITDKIDELSKEGLLDPQNQNEFMEDLIAEKLGVRVTEEEIKEVVKYTDKLKVLDGKLEGLQKTPVENVELYSEYFKTRDELNNYIKSLDPSGLPAIASSVIGRSFLLASIKSPVVNIQGNNVMTAIGSLTRRIETLSEKHPTIVGYNNDYAKDYVKTVWKIWQKSGYDISRMTSVTDDIKIRGENIIHSEGKGLVRKFARGMTDIVFKHAMGDYDVLSSAVNFSDSARLNSSVLAKQEGLSSKAAAKRAKEIFQDSTLISPRTLQGQEVREKAIRDAQYFTFTNNAPLSNFALRARDFINKLPGLKQFRIGDAQIPFAKVPANAINAAIDSSGVTAPYYMFRLVQGVKAGNRAVVDSSLRHLYLTGLGVLGAWLFVKALDPKDYIGDYTSYSQAERKLIEAEGGTYRSIRVGNRWISLDYFGPLMAPAVGFLEGQMGQSSFEKSQNYVLGVARQALAVPGLEELYGILKFGSESKTKKPLDIISEVKDGFLEFVVSRMLPAIISDVAGAIDQYQREARTIPEKVMRKIPGFREELKPKLNMFGEEIETENPLSTIFFGNRVKVYEDSPVLNELNRLGAQGMLPTLSDIQYSSDRAKQLKEQIGEEKFLEFIKYFGKEFFYSLENEFSKDSYKQLSDEEKKDRLNKIRSELIDKALKVYGYKKD